MNHQIWDNRSIAETAFPAIVKGLTNRDDIRIKFVGSASTDGFTINLGDIDRENPDAVQLALGHLCHEIFHIEHTDFKASALALDCFIVLNVLEDIRIERIAFERWPGTKAWRAFLMNYLIEHEGAVRSGRSDSLMMKVCIWLFWRLSREFIGHRLIRDPGVEAEEIVSEVLSREMMERILDLGRKGALSETTGEAAVHAAAIKKLLEKEEFLECKPQPIEKAAKLPKKGRGKPKNTENAHSINALYRKDFDMAQLSKMALGSFRKPASDSPDDASAAWRVVRSPLNPPKDLPAFLDHVRRYRRINGSRLEKFLKGRDSGSWYLKDYGKTVCPSALSRLSVGSARVFTQSSEVIKPTAAFTILLDRSGSMGIDMMTVAKEVTFSLCEILSHAPGSVCSCLAFPGMELRTLLELKNFEEPAKSCATRFAAVHAFGFTPILQSLNTAAAGLALRPEKRKFIVIITDGLCAEVDALTLRVRELEAKGFEILCLGIGEDSPLLFSHQRNIADTMNFAAALYELLESRFRIRGTRKQPLAA